MSYRFDDVDYEEEVIQEVVETAGETTVVDPKNPYGANPKWFLPPGAGDSDSDDDDNDERVADDLIKIQHRIGVFTSNPEDIDWKNIKKTIQSLQKALARFMKRSQKSRDIVGEILATVQTLMAEYASQDETRKNRTFDETQKLVDTVEEEVEAFVQDEDEDSDDDVKAPVMSESESKEDPVKVIARRLTESLSNKRDARRILKTVVNDAKTLQQPHLVACALQACVRLVLNKFSREKCLSVEGWKEAFAAFSECHATIQTNKLRVLESYADFKPETKVEREETSEKADETFCINYTTPKVTVVVGGVQGLYEELFEAVRRMANNNEKQFVQCLEAECVVVDFGFELMKSNRGGRIPNLVFSILSQRTPALHELMCKKFGLTTPFDIPALYQSCRADSMTMLQYAYHLALVGKYRDATVLLASDNSAGRILKPVEEWGERSLVIKDFVSTSIKVAYNRVLVQLALSNFKDGNVSEAADLLSNIREHTNKWGILFGQGAPFGNFQLPKEMRAKTTLLFNSIQTPPHYHIPQVSVELMYYVAISMKRAVQTSQGIQSYDRDSFSNLRRNINEVAGSASTPNEYIIAFDDALQAGDVPKMMDALNNLPFWGILDGEISKEKIAKKAKAIALQCFIYSSAANFSTITSKYLQERFEMTEAEVRKTINHTILTSPDHLTAYWETETEESIVVERCNVAGLRKTLGQAARNVSSIQAPSL